jgi:hypothetical protein
MCYGENEAGPGDRLTWGKLKQVGRVATVEGILQRQGREHYQMLGNSTPQQGAAWDRKSITVWFSAPSQHWLSDLGCFPARILKMLLLRKAALLSPVAKVVRLGV